VLFEGFGIVVFFDLHLSHPAGCHVKIHVEIQGTGFPSTPRIPHQEGPGQRFRQDHGGTTTLGGASKGKAGGQLGYRVGGGGTFNHDSGGGVLRRIQKL